MIKEIAYGRIWWLHFCWFDWFCYHVHLVLVTCNRLSCMLHHGPDSDATCHVVHSYSFNCMCITGLKHKSKLSAPVAFSFVLVVLVAQYKPPPLTLTPVPPRSFWMTAALVSRDFGVQVEKSCKAFNSTLRLGDLDLNRTAEFFFIGCRVELISSAQWSHLATALPSISLPVSLFEYLSFSSVVLILTMDPAEVSRLRSVRLLYYNFKCRSLLPTDLITSFKEATLNVSF